MRRRATIRLQVAEYSEDEVDWNSGSLPKALCLPSIRRVVVLKTAFPIKVGVFRISTS